MPPSHIPTRILPPSLPSLRATFATKRPQQAIKGRLNTYKRRLQLSSIQKPPESSSQSSRGERSPTAAVSKALRDANAQDNSLLAPVYVPEDPDSVLKEKHPAANILSTSAIVVQRQLELMNLTIGFEQANKYVILDPQGNHLGFIAERDLGMGNVMARQMFRTHRSFETHVFDKHEREVLRFYRPFSWISSNIRVYDPLVEASSTSHSPSSALSRTSGSDANGAPVQVSQLTLSDMRLIGEAQQQWAPLRRKYILSLFRQTAKPGINLSTRRAQPSDHTHSRAQRLEVSQAAIQGGEGQFSQFAYVDEAFLSWDFSLLSADSRLIGSVNKNFAGFGRELFTDTGVYALRMDAAGLAGEPKHLISKTGEQNEITRNTPAAGMTLDQRAVMLATAVSVDFDYFSQKSSSSGFMPLWFPSWGGGAAGEAGAGVAGAAGKVVEATTDLDRQVVAGAATLAGYDAVQIGVYGNGSTSAAGHSQHAGSPGAGSGPLQQNQGEEVWGEYSNPGGQSGSDGGGGGGKGSNSGGGGGEGAGGGGGEGAGGGDGFDITNLF